jgi:hypothetical protein
MALLVQDYLRTKGLQALVYEHSILAKRHSQYPNLVLLKYNQIETKMTPMTRECRGLILDEANDWAAVNYSYKRFANLGEGWGDADTIDWSSIRVMDKLDGSLGQLYYYDNAWHFATSGTADASGNVSDHGITFQDLFWRVFNELGYKLPERTDCCYAFELLSPLNALVVKYNVNRLVLHGVRCLSDFAELAPEPIAQAQGWECVKSWPLAQSVEELVEWVNKQDPFAVEGVVLCDAQFRRLKVKSLEHVLFSHLRDNLTSSRRNVLELVRKNETGDVLARLQQVPELKTIYDEVQAKYDALVDAIQTTYTLIEHGQTQKEYASMAVPYRYSSVLFQLRSKRAASVREALLGVQLKTLEEWLG